MSVYAGIQQSARCFRLILEFCDDFGCKSELNCALCVEIGVTLSLGVDSAEGLVTSFCDDLSKSFPGLHDAVESILYSECLGG